MSPNLDLLLKTLTGDAGCTVEVGVWHPVMQYCELWPLCKCKPPRWCELQQYAGKSDCKGQAPQYCSVACFGPFLPVTWAQIKQANHCYWLCVHTMSMRQDTNPCTTTRSKSSPVPVRPRAETTPRAPTYERAPRSGSQVVGKNKPAEMAMRAPCDGRVWLPSSPCSSNSRWSPCKEPAISLIKERKQMGEQAHMMLPDEASQQLTTDNMCKVKRAIEDSNRARE